MSKISNQKNNNNQLKTIIFDFDGVILDSMSIRLNGFKEIFKEHGDEPFNRFIPYHLVNGGVSRFIKIRYFYEEILGESITEEKIKELADKFTQIMRSNLIDSKFLIAETVEFIKQNHQKYELYIASGAEQNELRFLCQTHNLTPYFKAIYGSPTPKDELLANILKESNSKPNECLMIGDSINDFKAANANGIPFYGYNNESLRAVSVKYIDSFKEFLI